MNVTKSNDEQNPKNVVYECPDCEHKNINPEPDEDGDRVCEDCGCILPEKEIFECDVCKHENIEPEKNEDGDYLCENCGSALDIEVNRFDSLCFYLQFFFTGDCQTPHLYTYISFVCLPQEDRRTAAEKLKAINDDDSDAPRGGQEFDEFGRPITNPKGKKLTPADMFNPGDVITVTVGKSVPKQDPGLKVEERNGKYYVRKVPSGGLFARTPVIAGDKVLELNGFDSREFKNVNELKKILKDEPRITIVVLRMDPDASDSSASSVDYDELKAIKPPTKGEDDDETRATEDDDSVAYDDGDCGCVWCPKCQEQ